LTSDEVLTLIRPELVELGFSVEAGKRSEQKIRRPVFFGENAQPSLQYEIDAWHPEWRAGLEVEAGRAWMGNAVYRDLLLRGLQVGDRLLAALDAPPVPGEVLGQEAACPLVMVPALQRPGGRSFNSHIGHSSHARAKEQRPPMARRRVTLVASRPLRLGLG